MSLWVLLLVVAAVKLSIAALLIWIPLRSDEAMNAQEDGWARQESSAEDDGGSKTPPRGPLNPHPRRPLPLRPRRGPHGSEPVSAPTRVRRRPTRAVAPDRCR